MSNVFVGQSQRRMRFNAIRDQEQKTREPSLGGVERVAGGELHHLPE